MAEFESKYCPECDDAFDFPPPPPVDRRNFLRTVGGTAATLALGTVALGEDKTETKPEPKKVKPAEDLIRELFSGLKDEQKKKVVLPWDHGVKVIKTKDDKTKKVGRPTRLGMYNGPITKDRIETAYTKAQIELLERIVKAMSSGDDGYRRISRGGKWDNSGKLERCGAYIFGDPTGKNKFSFVFAGHHLTIRCDGNSEEGAAFGGPMYYGHSPNGWSRGNVFNYQSRSVQSLFKALDGKQQTAALVVKGNPGEQEKSVQFKKKAEDRPGLPIGELSKDQKALVEKVMRDVIQPFRKEDGDEVMAIIKKNGGMEKIKIAFYTETYMGSKTTKDQPWTFWRLEGPGFVWNYRVLPHVHTFVNISSKLT